MKKRIKEVESSKEEEITKYKQELESVKEKKQELSGKLTAILESVTGLENRIVQLTGELEDSGEEHQRKYVQALLFPKLISFQNYQTVLCNDKLPFHWKDAFSIHSICTTKQTLYTTPL